MHRHRVRLLACSIAVVSACALPLPAHAQRAWHAVAGVGPFLSRDRGWNYDRNLAASLGASVTLPAAFTLRALATVRTSRPGESSPSIYPPLPGSVTQGAAASLQLLSPHGPLGVYALGGIEYFRTRQAAVATTDAAAASLGLGLAWGTRHAWALEFRYARYARVLSTTHGHLDLAVLRVF